MTWDELKQEANEMLYKWTFGSNLRGTEQWITDHCLCFYNDGTITFNGEIIAYDRTPDQMLAIMKALQ